ncbi:MAG: HEAT repeat domain-containing protein, partial [Planctomycetota bacterium]
RLGELLDPAVAPGALADPAVRRRLTAAEPLREVAREASAVAFEDRSLDASVATLFSLLLPAVNDDAGIDWHTHLSRPTRAAALLAACRSRTSPESPTIAPGDDPLVAVAVGDEDAGIAELAARVAMRRHGERGGELAMRWLDSPHDGVRRLAEARVSRDGFDALWERWPKLPDAARRDLATALIKVDRRLHHRLAARLDEPDDGVRCRALAIIHDLNQGVYFQDRLTQLANAPSQAVASAAIRAMGTAESPETATALGDALRHPDPRRRADAAAALAHRGIDDDTDAAVRDTTRDDHAEPRAQAIAALHRTNPDAATDALHAMLDDDRPDHRDHALRLIASAGMVEMACPVAEMSISDRDPLVRRRASETIVELLRLLEAGTQASEDRSDPSPQEAA